MSIGSIPRALSIEFLDRTHNAQPMSLSERLKIIFKNITLEPLMFVYATSSILIQLTTSNLNLEKACRVYLQYNSSVCDAMSSRNKSGYVHDQEIEIQRIVSNMALFKSVCAGLFPALLMLFLGSWSDRRGKRKPVILIPLIGECITCICLFLCSHFFYELSLIYNALSETLPYTMTGAWYCAFVGIFSYVSGISSEENKTVRIGAISTCLNIGLTAGIFLSGHMIKYIGFEAIYLTSFLMLTLTVVYCLIIVKDDQKKKEIDEGSGGYLEDFFDIEHVKNTFKMCFSNRPLNKRKKMVIIMLLSMIIVGPFHGEYTVLYLFTRLKFGWNEVDYSYFNGVHFCIQTLGSIFAMTFLIKYLKMDDALIGCICVVGKLAACVVYSLAPTAPYFYIGAVVDVFNGTIQIVLRAMMAKIVPAEELGQSNSVFGICDAAMPLIFGPLYTKIYNYSIDLFPSAFFLVSAVFSIIACILFRLLFVINESERKIREDIKKNIEQEENLLKKACFNEIRKSMEKL